MACFSYIGKYLAFAESVRSSNGADILRGQFFFFESLKHGLITLFINRYIIMWLDVTDTRHNGHFFCWSVFNYK